MVRPRVSPARFLALACISLAYGQQPPIGAYIRNAWNSLTRSNRTIAAAAADPKFAPEPGGRWPVYISATEDLARVEAAIPASERNKIALRKQPASGTAQGLL